MKKADDMRKERTARVPSLAFTNSVAVVGDIHGCAATLRELVCKLGDVPIVTVGDVIDRGPGSREVIDILISIAAHGILGNHEEWFRAWVCGEGFDSYVLGDRMGGQSTLVSYGVQGRKPRQVEAERWRVPSEHGAWIRNLATAVDLAVGGQRFWVTHAGVPKICPAPGLTLDQVVPWLALNRPEALRHPCIDPRDMMPLDRPVIMGHQPLKDPLDLGHVIAIDTGAGTFENGRLTAVILPERRFVTVGPA